ncbi:MAG: type II secretion system protein [Chloroflexi bacterium]|nr:MAG: type II secretion system protein [Chloroflexota bacterium]
MGLQTNKLNKTESGFTIVELLIVIVVIGILAAITIVAFNGIQNRGKTASAQSAANVIIKKAEAANSVASAYPTSTATFAANNESTLTGSGVDLAAITAGTAPTKSATVEYTPCATTSGAGAQVSYYDYTKSGAATKVTQTIGGACTTWATGPVTGTY